MDDPFNNAAGANEFEVVSDFDDIGGLIGEGGDQFLPVLLPSDRQEDMATFRADSKLSLGA